jgi:hypothetical protein
MSLNVNKDNIYLITNHSKYMENELVSDFMEKDFTLFLRVKIVKWILTEDESFIFSRNGVHSGLSCYLNHLGNIVIRFSYWFKNKDNKVIHKHVEQILPENMEELFNDYIIICNMRDENIKFYLFDKLIGIIDFKGLEKVDYTTAFFWLGCGSMIVEENFKNIGSFIYKLLFGLNVPLTYDEIIDIVQYREKYVNEDSEFGLPLVKRDIDLYKNFKLFFDFEFKNKYKVWNMVNGNNFFQKYIEDNIIF